MKTLLLLRHAKSSWKFPELGDHDRPLKPRGIAAAKTIARLFPDPVDWPQVVLCSSAVRTRETWRLMQEVWTESAEASTVCDATIIPEATVIPELYHCEPELFRQRVADCPEPADCVLVIGHNPGLEEWAAVLTRHPVVLPTAALLRLELKISHWSDIDAAEGTARISGLWRPRELTEDQ